jgi:cysteine desulfurase
VLRRRAPPGSHRIPFLVDAVAAGGHVPIDVNVLDADLLALSSHKFGGPKGAGLLYVRRGIPFASLITGGGQERQRRAGTENVPGIIGTAKALELAERERVPTAAWTIRLRDRLIDGLLGVSDTVLNGPREGRLPNNVNVSFADVEGERLLAELDRRGIAASSGSACASSTWEPSHVLMAMGVPPRFAVGSLRLTLSSSNTAEEVVTVIEAVTDAVHRLRRESSVQPAGIEA